MTEAYPNSNKFVEKTPLSWSLSLLPYQTAAIAILTDKLCYLSVTILRGDKGVGAPPILET